MILILFFYFFNDALSKAVTIQLSDGYGVRGNVEGISTTFYGIPYAEPPVGLLRWKTPRKFVPKTKNLVVQSHEPPACMQDKKIKQSEDCLYLNVFAPTDNLPQNTQGVKPLCPVVIYFHFGSFSRGSSLGIPGQSFGIYNKKGIIYISANFRLGIFGYFSHPGLSNEDPNHKTNFGLYDQREVMKWVKRNIKNFGGDPDKITILGISSGASSVLWHLVSNDEADDANDASGPLFHRAVAHSPALITAHGTESTFAAKEAIGVAFASVATALSDKRSNFTETAKGEAKKEKAKNVKNGGATPKVNSRHEMGEETPAEFYAAQLARLRELPATEILHVLSLLSQQNFNYSSGTAGGGKMHRSIFAERFMGDPANRVSDLVRWDLEERARKEKQVESEMKQRISEQAKAEAEAAAAAAQKAAEENEKGKGKNKGKGKGKGKDKGNDKNAQPAATQPAKVKKIEEPVEVEPTPVPSLPSLSAPSVLQLTIPSPVAGTVFHVSPMTAAIVHPPKSEAATFNEYDLDNTEMNGSEEKETEGEKAQRRKKAFYSVLPRSTKQKLRRVPLLIGTVKNEMSMFLHPSFPLRAPPLSLWRTSFGELCNGMADANALEREKTLATKELGGRELLMESERADEAASSAAEAALEAEKKKIAEEMNEKEGKGKGRGRGRGKKDKSAAGADNTASSQLTSSSSATSSVFSASLCPTIASYYSPQEFFHSSTWWAWESVATDVYMETAIREFIQGISIAAEDPSFSSNTEEGRISEEDIDSDGLIRLTPNTLPPRPRIYRFLFDHSPYNSMFRKIPNLDTFVGYGAFHTGDAPYFIGGESNHWMNQQGKQSKHGWTRNKVLMKAKLTDEEQKLQQTATDIWAHFIQTGGMKGNQHTNWPVWKEEKEEFVRFHLPRKEGISEMGLEKGGCVTLYHHYRTKEMEMWGRMLKERTRIGRVWDVLYSEWMNERWTLQGNAPNDVTSSAEWRLKNYLDASSSSPLLALPSNSLSYLLSVSVADALLPVLEQGDQDTLAFSNADGKLTKELVQLLETSSEKLKQMETAQKKEKTVYESPFVLHPTVSGMPCESLSGLSSTAVALLNSVLENSSAAMPSSSSSIVSVSSLPVNISAPVASIMLSKPPNKFSISPPFLSGSRVLQHNEPFSSFIINAYFSNPVLPLVFVLPVFSFLLWCVFVVCLMCCSSSHRNKETCRWCCCCCCPCCRLRVPFYGTVKRGKMQRPKIKLSKQQMLSINGEPGRAPGRGKMTPEEMKAKEEELLKAKAKAEEEMKARMEKEKSN